MLIPVYTAKGPWSEIIAVSIHARAVRVINDRLVDDGELRLDITERDGHQRTILAETKSEDCQQLWAELGDVSTEMLRTLRSYNQRPFFGAFLHAEYGPVLLHPHEDDTMFSLSLLNGKDGATEIDRRHLRDIVASGVSPERVDGIVMKLERQHAEFMSELEHNMERFNQSLVSHAVAEASPQC